MKLQNIISICLLTVYSLVLSHSFVPHHHHSQTAIIVKHCYHDEHHHQHDHDTEEEHIQVCHNHAEEHVHCSFEDVIILSKTVNLSEFYSLIAYSEIEFAEEEKQRFEDFYIIPYIPELRCQDLQLRGPPNFS